MAGHSLSPVVGNCRCHGQKRGRALGEQNKEISILATFRARDGVVTPDTNH